MSLSIHTSNPAYRITKENEAKAIEKGLAEADWYTCYVPRETMRALLKRKNGPAIRDTVIWFGLMITFAAVGIYYWFSWVSVIAFMLYGIIYGTTSDSRWHESSHGTAFKTDWMNNWLYEIASFMVMRESVVWRWSHNRHHSDTIIVGRDPEIVSPRPAKLSALFGIFINLDSIPGYFCQMVHHACGQMSESEKLFIPASEFKKIYSRARITLLIYLLVIGVSIYFKTIIPLLLIGLPNIYGAWLMPIYGLTQHAGLAENVLDHRLNCRTVYMNALNRFLYWNMNYHTEHHMFPLVPYHALPRLHELVKDEMPSPYPSIISAWKEIIPALLKQRKDPSYYVKRILPERPAHHPANNLVFKSDHKTQNGWHEVCDASNLSREEVVRFDVGNKTFAISCAADGKYYATDGICTHGNTHLAEGLVKGGQIECPKHNGRFNLADGSPARAPICQGLRTYPVELKEGKIYMDIESPGGSGIVEPEQMKFKVVSNENVSTFIKELVIEPLEKEIVFKAGNYLQIEIPQYELIEFRNFDIPEPYRSVWETHNLFDLVVENTEGKVSKNNYSLAVNPGSNQLLKFNVRIATPPVGQDCAPGRGSSYIFNLKPGEVISAVGPFGDFDIKPTQKEMVYIGGGAGMAPLRSHISHLFETLNTSRTITYWYGARSEQELFYVDYFRNLSREFKNFQFHAALSDDLPDDAKWEGHRGYIHSVVESNYLKSHPNLSAVEFYLCGPPMMIKACSDVLKNFGVNDSQIAFDEF
ncbi:NADH:ubiquinone reductase (Na(+)-transporting) subunit F [Flavobacterium gilvum]|uniref:NADH:ubiquinone reductase (Na(+)-transporting) subunit F n=1 Tax=Flavobacterium gilvum TaxID=1492737 RepID=A0A085EEC6_9FLAO|nr:NADH:ubiquinone reductase (Na(+)-transporting) subunit F [Flavobacterium gilvum]AOW10789.1 NADH:ubiquinone reductase (Na(+)-transporting) subunit F [Flavobacterium gilvum]KFC57571.1 hypothetical protein FEM08_36530 [Flavobacterium gilvum]KFC59940.1 hypothetical protein FEM08_12440 [Flavobacterium gilvum]